MEKSRACPALLLGFTAAVVLSSSAQAQEPPRSTADLIALPMLSIRLTFGGDTAGRKRCWP